MPLEDGRRPSVATTGSKVVFNGDGTVTKTPRKTSHAAIARARREYNWLYRLGPTDAVPQVHDFSEADGSITMSDAGVPIGADNAPPDWQEQLSEILNILKKFGCQHNDLSPIEVLVDPGNKKLRLVDFAVASSGGSLLYEPPARWFAKTRTTADECILSYLDLVLNGPPDGTEPHVFVLWNPDTAQACIEQIGTRFRVVWQACYQPHFWVRCHGSRDRGLNKLYGMRRTHRNDKGNQPFYVLVVLDEQPNYGHRQNMFTGIDEFVNVNIFDVKVQLRDGKAGEVHGSLNLHEALRNLRVLTPYPESLKAAPLDIWYSWRPKFDSLEIMTEALRGELQGCYSFLRRPDFSVAGEIKGDIDLLVDDYHGAKRVLGGIAYKENRSCWRRGQGRPVDEGGYKVANRVSIGGREVQVDIRHVGDGYLDEQWQRDLLTNSSGSFRRPFRDVEVEFWALLHHYLNHKWLLSPRHLHLLSTVREDAGDGLVVGGFSGAFNLGQESPLNDRTVRTRCALELQRYMRSKGYKDVAASELSIPWGAWRRDRSALHLDRDRSHQCSRERNWSGTRDAAWVGLLRWGNSSWTVRLSTLKVAAGLSQGAIRGAAMCTLERLFLERPDVFNMLVALKRRVKLFRRASRKV